MKLGSMLGLVLVAFMLLSLRGTESLATALTTGAENEEKAGLADGAALSKVVKRDNLLLKKRKGLLGKRGGNSRDPESDEERYNEE